MIRRTPHGPGTGIDVLYDPHTNKGTGFTEEERDRLKIRGLVPPRRFTLAEQQVRVLENLRSQPNNLARYVFALALQDRNERLFYRIVIDHIEELMPIIYTPTVGEACLEFAHIFRRPRGLYVTAEDRGRVADVLRNWPYDDVRIIVMTDGERILGLGDLGASGMGIPIGKLALYTACAGLRPEWCLPIMLDVGSDNEAMREDPLYLGLHRERLRGETYDELLEEVVTAVQEVFPRAILQFEDFANHTAIPLLARYRERARTFNDDIQGTAAVALAGLLAAARITKRPLRENRILFVGAGAAATGIGSLVANAMARDGIDADEAHRRLWFHDSHGLVVASRTDLEDHKKPFAHDHPPIHDLATAVDTLEPSVLIGASGQPGVFTAEILAAMARFNERPVIFALSNPTSRAECTAEAAYRATAGRCVFASGSPFAPVELDGKRHTPGQGNNAYIFPGLGLGVIAGDARRITEEMFHVAAETLAGQVTEAMLAEGRCFPPLSQIRSVSAQIAAAVAAHAREVGLAGANLPRDPGELHRYVEGLMYNPSYDEPRR